MGWCCCGGGGRGVKWGDDIEKVLSLESTFMGKWGCK